MVKNKVLDHKSAILYLKVKNSLLDWKTLFSNLRVLFFT